MNSDDHQRYTANDNRWHLVCWLSWHLSNGAISFVGEVLPGVLLCWGGSNQHEINLSYVFTRTIHSFHFEKAWVSGHCSDMTTCTRSHPLLYPTSRQRAAAQWAPVQMRRPEKLELEEDGRILSVHGMPWRCICTYVDTGLFHMFVGPLKYCQRLLCMSGRWMETGLLLQYELGTQVCVIH